MLYLTDMLYPPHRYVVSIMHCPIFAISDNIFTISDIFFNFGETTLYVMVQDPSQNPEKSLMIKHDFIKYK